MARPFLDFCCGNHNDGDDDGDDYDDFNCIFNLANYHIYWYASVKQFLTPCLNSALI